MREEFWCGRTERPLCRRVELGGAQMKSTADAVSAGEPTILGGGLREMKEEQLISERREQQRAEKSSW